MALLLGMCYYRGSKIEVSYIYKWEDFYEKNVNCSGYAKGFY